MKPIKIELNLQEGIFLNKKLNKVLAVYNSHNKVIFVMRNSLKEPDFKIPKEFKEFKVITGFTGGIMISLWSKDNFKPIYEVLSEYKEIGENIS